MLYNGGLSPELLAMASQPPSRALFEHSFPEELSLSVERGVGGAALELRSANPLDARASLERALKATEDPLELELRLAPLASEEHARELAGALLDLVEERLRGRELSERSELRWRSSSEVLLRALVDEMRRRYVGDPPRAR
ncbi:MAG: hypothetical protein IPN34_16515 [Planctomycetes bacterium]|nr:hypothetical protein [Planctomycetota bacterium]